MKFEELKKIIENLPIEGTLSIEESKIVISFEEDVTSDKDITDTLKLFIKDPSKIQKTASGWKVDTSDFSKAQKLWQIMTAMFADKYQFSTPDQFTLVIVKKSSGDIVNNGNNAAVKPKKSPNESLDEAEFDPEEISKFVDSLGFKKASVDIYNDRIEVTGVDSDTLGDIAEQIDKKYPNLDIVLKDDKLIIK